ncbi:MAG: beta-ketoacyl-ACP synthase 3 [Acidobacteriia bacterium]|nr:beta-ketoacyl-ACP synthase 3 [Terriglobia bacterium]
MISEIVATGSYLPERVVKNADLKQFPASSIPLIASKTGVLERRYAAEGQSTSDLAVEAARRCLARAEVAAGELDGIILATSSPDQPMPATCNAVQAKLEAWAAFAVDVNAVCTGAIYALRMADAMIRAGQARRLLVVGAELYTRFLNPTDFSTYPYFGDGAGAVLLAGAEKPARPYILGGTLHADGRGADLITRPAGGSRLPYPKMTDPRQQYFQMNGRAVFDFAVARGAEVIDELCRAYSIPRDQVRHLVLHQANMNVLTTIAQKTALPLERFMINLDRYGNTAGASPLIALDELAQGNPARELKGTTLVVAFGGGLTWGGIIIALPQRQAN